MKELFAQIQPAPGQTYRVGLLTSICKPRAATYHWFKDEFIRCNSMADDLHECCNSSKHSWTCVALAIRYMSADKDGKLGRGSAVSVSIGYVGMSRAGFSQASEFLKESPECDLYYSNAGGNYLIEGAGREPRWKGSPQAAAILAAAQENADGSKLISKLGGKLTDEEWSLLIGTGSKFGVDSDED